MRRSLAPSPKRDSKQRDGWTRSVAVPTLQRAALYLLRLSVTRIYVIGSGIAMRDFSVSTHCYVGLDRLKTIDRAVLCPVEANFTGGIASAK